MAGVAAIVSGESRLRLRAAESRTAAPGLTRDEHTGGRVPGLIGQQVSAAGQCQEGAEVDAFALIADVEPVVAG